MTRKVATNADYWDYATLLELAVLGDDREAADENLSEVAAFARHAWEVESTKRNLGMIRQAREARNEDAGVDRKRSRANCSGSPTSSNPPRLPSLLGSQDGRGARQTPSRYFGSR